MEQAGKKTGLIIGICAGSAVLVTAVLLLTFLLIIPTANYNKAVELRAGGDFASAEAVFTELGGFLDAREQIRENRYLQACNLLETGRCAEAIALFTGLEDYRDAPEKALLSRYRYAEQLPEQGKYEEAMTILPSP